MTLAKIFLSKLRLFEGRPDLAARGRYTIASDVDREVVDLFFARVMGDDAAVVTADNAEQLQALCNELGFSGFDEEIRAVLGSDDMAKRFHMEIRKRFDGHDVRIEEQGLKLAQFGDALGRLEKRVNEIASQLAVIPSIEQRLSEVLRAVREEFPERFRAVEEFRRNDVQEAVAEARREVGALRKDVEQLRSKVGEKASAADAAALSAEVARVKKAEAKPAQGKRATKTVAEKDQRESCDKCFLGIHVGRAEGLVCDVKMGGLDTYVRFEIEGRKGKIKSMVVQNSFDPIYDDDVAVESPNPESDILVITVVSKEVGRDKEICDEVKIPVKDFLPIGKSEERVLHLKKKKKDVGTLYLSFRSKEEGRRWWW